METLRNIEEKNRTLFFAVCALDCVVVLLDLWAIYELGRFFDGLSFSHTMPFSLPAMLIVFPFARLLLCLAESRMRERYYTQCQIQLKERLLLVLSAMELPEQQAEETARFSAFLQEEIVRLRKGYWPIRLMRIGRILSAVITSVFLVVLSPYLVIAVLPTLLDELWQQFFGPRATGFRCSEEGKNAFAMNPFEKGQPGKRKAIRQGEPSTVLSPDDAFSNKGVLSVMESYKLLGLNELFFAQAKKEEEKRSQEEESRCVRREQRRLLENHGFFLLQLFSLFAGLFVLAQGKLTAGGVLILALVLVKGARKRERTRAMLHRAQENYPVMERVSTFLLRSPLNKENYPGGTRTISFRDLTVSLDPSFSTPLFDRFNRNIRQGSLVAVIGPPGSGKRTLMQTMIGALRPQSGLVTFDGHDVREYEQASFLRKVRYVPEKTVFFDGTVEENILLGRSLSDSEWKEWRTFFGFTEVELHQELSPKSPLSTKERMRIGLCRVVVDHPEILIFTDPFSDLDAQTTDALRTRIRRLPATKIILLHDDTEEDLTLYDQIIRLS